MKICFVPTYRYDYSRLRVIKKGLRLNNVKVIDCSSKNKSFLLRHIEAFLNFLKHQSKADVILIGFYGQLLTPIISLFTKKKIVLDAFMSTYNTLVEDKKKIKKKSIGSKVAFYIDKIACKKADLILLDTKTHIKYFCHTFKINPKKFRRTLVGTDNEIFFPKENKTNKQFKVVFYGTYVPLQGIEYIIKAAKKLEKEKISFELIGNGQTFKKNLKLANTLKVKNIKFINTLPIDKLSNHISKADIVLGIFGKTKKANFVIPNKVYDALACEKPLITSDTIGIRELIKDRFHAYLCKEGNEESLKNAIMELKNNKILREKIAKNGYKLFKEKCTPKEIGKELKKDIEQLIIK